MKAWRVCGSNFGEVIYADDATAASASYEYFHGSLPKEIARAPTLDGDPRDHFTNAEMQAAGFAVFCDRCLAEAAFDALPDEIKGEFGSMTTARRVFGRRKPGDASAGGRPPNVKKRKQR